MEHDPQTQAAAEEAAATSRDGETTDGVHGAGEPPPPSAAPAGDAGPEAHAAAAGVAQAAATEPDDAPAPSEPDYRDQYLRAMAELDNVRKRARRDVSQAEARGIAKLARELLPAI